MGLHEMSSHTQVTDGEVIDFTNTFVLGLDISTKQTGWTLFMNGMFRAWGLLKKNEDDDVYGYSIAFEATMTNIASAYNVDDIKIVIESPLLYHPRSSFPTGVKLGTVYGMFFQIAYKVFKIQPIHVAPSTARAPFGLCKRKRETEANIKKRCIAWVENDANLQLFDEYDIRSAGDLADSYILAKFGI